MCEQEFNSVVIDVIVVANLHVRVGIADSTVFGQESFVFVLGGIFFGTEKQHV